MPGITDPAQEYFKNGLWGWATSTWEKLLSVGGRLFTAPHGWDGSNWRKLPMLWGYSAVYHEEIEDLTASVGSNTLLGTEVPPGEVWIVTHMVARNKNKTGVTVALGLWDGSNSYNFRRVTTSAVNEFVAMDGPLVLEAGDQGRASIASCTAGDDLYLTLTGYKMKIAE